jgi:hypothetical protein
MKPLMRLVKRLKARRLAFSFSGSEEEGEEEVVTAAAMAAKSVVPESDFQPACLLRISSAREMCRSFVEAGESLPTLAA